MCCGRRTRESEGFVAREAGATERSFLWRWRVPVSHLIGDCLGERDWGFVEQGGASLAKLALFRQCPGFAGNRQRRHW